MLEQKIRSLIFVFSTDCLALKLNEIFLSVKILTIRPKNKMVKYIIESVVPLNPSMYSAKSINSCLVPGKIFCKFIALIVESIREGLPPNTPDKLSGICC